MILQVTLGRWNHEFDHLHCYRYCNQHVKIQLFSHQKKKKCGENSELSIHLQLFRFVTVYGFQQEYALFKSGLQLTEQSQETQRIKWTNQNLKQIHSDWVLISSVLLRTRCQIGRIILNQSLPAKPKLLSTFTGNLSIYAFYYLIWLTFGKQQGFLNDLWDLSLKMDHSNMTHLNYFLSIVQE